VLEQAAVALLWSPWFALRFVLLPAANRGAGASPPLAPALLAQLWQALWAGAWAMVGQEPALAWLAALLFVLAVALIPWRDPAARWLVVHALLIVAGLVAALQVVGLGLHARYLVMVAPLVLVALAGPARLAETHAARPRCPRRAGALALAPFVAASAQPVGDRGQARLYHDDVADGARLRRDVGPDDAVFAYLHRPLRPRLLLGSPRRQARRVILPENADLPRSPPRLQGTARSSSATGRQPADQRLMLPCLLGTPAPGRPRCGCTSASAARVIRGPRSTAAIEPLRATFAVARVTALGARPRSPPTGRCACRSRSSWARRRPARSRPP
jgi:hypothetical protein